MISKAKVVLELDAQQVREVTDILDDVSNAGGDADGSIGRLAETFRKAGAAGIDAARGQLAGWEALENRINDVREAYKKHVQEMRGSNQTPQSATSFAGSEGVSTGDLENYAAGANPDVVRDGIQEVRELSAAQKELTATQQRLKGVGLEESQDRLAQAFRRVSAAESEALAARESGDAKREADATREYTAAITELNGAQKQASDADREQVQAQNQVRASLKGLAEAQAEQSNAEMNARGAAEMERRRQAAAETDDWAEAERRLTAAQAQRAKVEAAESNRQMDGRAAAEIRERAEAERRATKDANDLAEAEDRLRKAREKGDFQGADDREESIATARAQLEKRTEGATRAERELANAREAGDVREQVAATKRMTDALDEQTAASRRLDQAQDEQLNKLPRLRYAMYDVSDVARRMATVMTAAVGATAVASASYESAFTAVERTSGVVGSSVNELREEMIGLTRDIPQSFDEITDIAARGAQLGIATESLGAFTDTIAKFVATSDTVTLDQAVESLGRLSNLLGESDYNALGSAISLVGVNAAATEGAIVRTAQELAPFSAAVGVTTDETIGLATAVASLGQSPERTRSAFLALQKTMDKTVVEGGQQLQNYADLLGVTADEASKMWQQDPTQFISSLVSALSTVDNLTVAFDNLGLTQSRTVQVFQALAADARNAGDGMSVLQQALLDANVGYAEGTELARQYSKIADDLASRWQIFVNALMEAGAALGDALAPMLVELLGVVTPLLQGFAEFIETPIGQFFASVGGAATVFAIALTGVVAAFTSVAAGAFALRTVLAEMGWSAATTGIGGFINGLSASATAMRGQTSLLGGLSAGFATTGGAARGAAIAVQGFKVALATTGIGLAVVAIGSLVSSFTMAGNAASGFATDYSGISGALKEDTKRYQETGEAIATFTQALPEQTAAQKDTAQQAENFAIVLGGVADASKSVEDQTRKTTLAIGEQGAEFIKNQFRMSQELDGLLADDKIAQLWQQSGFDIDEVMKRSLSSANPAESRAAVAAYFKEVLDTSGLEIEIDPTGAGASQVYELADGTRVLASELGPLVDGFSGAGRGVQDVVNEMEIFGEVERDAEGNIQFTTDAIDEQGGAFEEMAGKVESVLDPIFTLLDAEMGLQRSLDSLGQSLVNNGSAWDIYSEAGRSNIDAVRQVMESMAAQTPGDTAAIAANFQGLYDFLISGGHATADNLGFLAEAIAGLVNTSAAGLSGLQGIAGAAADAVGGGVSAGRTLTSFGGLDLTSETNSLADLGFQLDEISRPRPMPDFTSIFNGMETATRGAGSGARDAADGMRELQEEIVTTADYASDLSGVMDRAFELRWGSGMALDDIRDSWEKLREEAEEAREAVKEYKAELSDMKVDRSSLEYWLSVAESYGDEKRAAELREEIAKKNREIADTEKKIADEKAKADRSTDGNTQAARDNRAALLDLVQQYQKYIEELANSGLSQDELAVKTDKLRQDFIEQAVQMGFGRDEALKYASSFDDMRKAIDEVPRNVTIEVNADPALTALREFVAAAEKAGRDAGSGISGGVGGGLAKIPRNIDMDVKMYAPPPYATVEAYFDAIAYRAKLVRDSIMPSEMFDGTNLDPDEGRGLRTGGYTGAGDPDSVAGVVHRGEYVFNAQATSALGPNMLSRMHAAAKRGQMLAPGGGGAGGVTELGAATLQSLQQIFGVRLNLDGRVLADSASQQFARSNRIGSA